MTETGDDAADPGSAAAAEQVSTYRPRLLLSVVIRYVEFSLLLAGWFLGRRLQDAVMHTGDYQHPAPITDIPVLSFFLALFPTIVVTIAFSWGVRTSAAGLDLMLRWPRNHPQPIRIPWSAIRSVSMDSRLLRVHVVDAHRVRNPWSRRTPRQPSQPARTKGADFAISMRCMSADDVDNIRRDLHRYLPDGQHP